MVFILALLIVVYGVAKMGWWPKSYQISLPSKQTVIPFVFPTPEANKQLADWTNDEVIQKINDYRATYKLPPLKSNSLLDNAAKNRLAVLLEFNDYDGKQTGLTRENALKNVGYNYSWVGDLVLLGYFKNNDPIGYWTSIDNSLATLKDKNLKEVGVAIKQTAEQVDVYVMLATKGAVSTTSTTSSKATWGGPELWDAVNKARVSYGVSPLKQKDELCTIAAIRLDQLIQLGKLDDHAGFVPTLERPDLKWIADQYNISEFLAYGFQTVDATVKGWGDTLGHKKLLTGGEYVWGCIYAQNTFAVAIAAY